MARKERDSLIVRLPKGMKGQLLERVECGPYPSMNQFIVEACAEKLKKTCMP